MENFFEMLSYPFMLRALIVGGLVALCSSLLGVSLVLKHCSMIGDGLSHVAFGALAAATALGAAPMAVTIPVVVIAAVLLLKLSENSRIKGDAAIALISAGALAIGVMILSFSSGVNIDVFNYLFGSILAISRNDVALSVILSLTVLVAYILLYSRIFAVTFDENFARATGTPAGAYDLILAVLTAVTIVLGMRLMGALLISSLIIFPPLSSMRCFGSFRSVVISSAVLSVICFAVGLTISYFFSAPAGASIVCVNIAAFALSALCGALRRRSTK